MERYKKRCVIIAEAGVNHNGDLEMAKRLIEKAGEAGADFVKFQTFKADRIVTAQARKAGYQLKGTDQAEGQLEMIQRLEIDRPAHEILIAHCEANQIGFLSTPFDEESVDLLVELGITAFKVPSGEITNVPYLRKIGATSIPVYLSTGMATLGEVEFAIQTLEAAGSRRDEMTVLHCNTEYPTPMHDVNLMAMQTMEAAFNVAPGYSDHTLGIEVPIAAMALGARVIEKHFTLDRNLEGPDHAASLEPQELAAMVRAIRNVECALGDGVKMPTASESKNIPIVRKSLVASKPIREGERLTKDNVTAKRPGFGISAASWDEVMGRIARRNYQPDDLIEW
ncbi:N-acetylneuraminate synthase [Akkermansiaceae bacterium]|nr:N-acetylneuraminate synthase [Akkermansiaceae bacterium]